VARQSIGERVFRLERTLNASVYDSTMVGIAKRLERGKITDFTTLNNCHSSMLRDEQYLKAISRATSNENSVKLRCTKAIDMFSNVK
jgi:hypothetical protein